MFIVIDMNKLFTATRIGDSKCNLKTKLLQTVAMRYFVGVSNTAMLNLAPPAQFIAINIYATIAPS